MKKITNQEQIINELADFLFMFDVNLNEYQTDVYLYIDDNGVGSLNLFCNVGGNSWIDDDHYTLYSDKQHFETPFDSYTKEELVDAIEYPYPVIEQMIMQKTGLDADELCWQDFVDLISDDDDLYTRFMVAYKGYLRDEVDYFENARIIFDDFIEHQEELERMREEWY